MPKQSELFTSSERPDKQGSRTGGLVDELLACLLHEGRAKGRDAGCLLVRPPEIHSRELSNYG